MSDCQYCGVETAFFPLCHCCEKTGEVSSANSVRQLLYAIFTVVGRPDAAALMPARCDYIDRPIESMHGMLGDVVYHSDGWPGGLRFWAQAFKDTLNMTRDQDLDVFWLMYISRPSHIIINQTEGQL